MSDFGRDDPREMPAYLFRGALQIDYASAVRADALRQYCSICPRHWYVDARFPCARCGGEFAFSAAEQRAWYEDYGFWVDSLPRHCQHCRRSLRALAQTRREYDACVEAALAGDLLEPKQRLARLIDELYELGGPLPPRIHEKRRRVARQLERLERRRA